MALSVNSRFLEFEKLVERYLAFGSLKLLLMIYAKQFIADHELVFVCQRFDMLGG